MQEKQEKLLIFCSTIRIMHYLFVQAYHFIK